MPGRLWRGMQHDLPLLQRPVLAQPLPEVDAAGQRWPAMKCPRRQSDSVVLATRDDKRRRQCSVPVCGHRWTTYEVSAEDLGKLRANSLRLARVRALANEAQA